MAVTDTDRNPAHLQPAFREKVRLWLNDCTAEHLDLHIEETLRTYGRQAFLYAQGRTRSGPRVTNAKPGQSYHAFGLALDVYPFLPNASQFIDWNFDPNSPQWRRIVKLAKGRGLAWGGNWRTFKDLPHFQDAKVPPLWMLRLKWPHGWAPPC